MKVQAFKYIMMNKIIYILIISIIVSCNNRDINQYDLPNDKDVNTVIKKIIEIDSIKTDNGFTISKRLCQYTLDYSLDLERDLSTPPPQPNLSIVNPISPKIIIDFFKTKMDSSINICDTAFYTAQIVHSKNRFIDTSLYIDFKFSIIEFLKHKDCYRLDSIIIFNVPIFSKDKNFAYLNYHYCGYGKGTILRRVLDNWIIYKEFDTWNRDLK